MSEIKRYLVQVQAGNGIWRDAVTPDSSYALYGSQEEAEEFVETVGGLYALRIVELEASKGQDL